MDLTVFFCSFCLPSLTVSLACPCTMKIDIHTHILPDKWPDLKERFGYGGWLKTEPLNDGRIRMMYDDGRFFRDVERNCFDPAVRLVDMDKTGVTVQALSTVPVMFNYWAKPEHTADFSRILNENISATVAKHPSRFFGLGTLPMQSPELAVNEMKHSVSTLGLSGFQIGSHINDWNLDANELDPVWSCAQDLDVPIFVHPWDMQTDGRMSKYWLPWLVGMPAETATAMCSVIMGGVLDRFPKLRLVFAHGGGAYPFICGRVQHGYDVRPDLCATACSSAPSTFAGRFYTDSLVHDARALRLLLDVVGSDKVLLGSDYPFPLGEHHPGKLVDEENITERAKEMILFKNALECFNLDSKRFVSCS